MEKNKIEEIAKGFSWQEITCLERNISFRLPQDWQRARDEVVEHKFPYSIKPQEIFVDLEENKFLTLNLLNKPLQETHVYPAVYEIQRLISRMYPESIQKSANRLQAAAGMIGYFVFVTGGIMHDTVHCMFILPVKKMMMFGSYHFPIEGMPEEMPFFKKVLRSIQVLEDEKDNCIIVDKKEI